VARRDFLLIFDAEVPSHCTGIFATVPTAFGAAFFQRHPGPSLCEQKDMIPISGGETGPILFCPQVHFTLGRNPLYRVRDATMRCPSGPPVQGL